MNSDGWTVIGPIRIQRWAPRPVFPRTSTTNSRNTFSAKMT